MPDIEKPEFSRLDRLIEKVSPTWAAHRWAARVAIWKDRCDIEASYRGGVTTRLDRGFSASSGQTWANHPLSGGRLTNLRDRARSLDRNNNLASSSLDRATENVIGHGPTLQMRSKNQAYNKAVEQRWEKWIDEADIRELNDLYSLLRLDYRTELREGDVGIILVDRGGFPRLQYVEGDMIEAPAGKIGNGVVDGIRWNSVGAPREFWVKSIDEKGRTTHAAIPRGSFIYSMRMGRFSQVRGEPVFSQTFWLFDHLDGYVEGVVTSARAGACQALIIKKKAATNTFNSITATTKDAQGNTRKKMSLEPLTVHYLEPDEEAQGFNPTQPAQNFDSAVNTFSRLLGLNLGLAVEQMLLDFSKVTYLSSRAMRAQADETAAIQRDRFERRKLRRILPWWIDRMAALGEIPSPPDDGYAHEWIYEPRPWVDPDKDIRAALMELDMGLTTLEILAKERGREFAELVQKRSEEIKAMRKANIPIVMSNQTREAGQSAESAGDAAASGVGADGEDKNGQEGDEKPAEKPADQGE